MSMPRSPGANPWLAAYAAGQSAARSRYAGSPRLPGSGAASTPQQLPPGVMPPGSLGLPPGSLGLPFGMLGYQQPAQASADDGDDGGLWGKLTDAGGDILGPVGKAFDVGMKYVGRPALGALYQEAA